jgi:hypothetical protein
MALPAGDPTTVGTQAGQPPRHWRQLCDLAGSAEVDSMAPVTLNFYAGLCGWTRSVPHPTKE